MRRATHEDRRPEKYGGNSIMLHRSQTVRVVFCGVIRGREAKGEDLILQPRFLVRHPEQPPPTVRPACSGGISRFRWQRELEREVYLIAVMRSRQVRPRPCRLPSLFCGVSMPDENSTNVALENATLEGGRALRLS